MRRKIRIGGYVLIEISIAIFIFSVLLYVLSVFMKRAVIIEKVKKDSQLKDERIYRLPDRIAEDIAGRDRRGFVYNGIKGDIFVSEREVIFKKGDMFYKLEAEDGVLFVSDGEKIERMGMKINMGEYDTLKFQKIDMIFLIKAELNRTENIRIVNLR